MKIIKHAIELIKEIEKNTFEEDLIMKTKRRESLLLYLHFA